MTYEDLRARLLDAQDMACGGGVDDTQIAMAEEALQVTLPRDFRRFLREFGWLEMGPTEIFGLGSDVPQHLNLVTLVLAERRDSRVPMPRDLVPVMNDGGGNLYCLDCSEASGRMALWDHTTGLELLDEVFPDWLVEELDQDDE
jgi:SMI1-KNR4 cell-wall